MLLFKDTEKEQLKELVNACMVEIETLKNELKECQKKLENLKDTRTQIKEKDKKFAELKEILDRKNTEIAELKKIKKYFNAITSKPKKDLTSFQSQIYQLLPTKQDTTEDLYIHIKKIGFEELLYDSFVHILMGLERKGYVRSHKKDEKIIWEKIEK